MAVRGPLPVILAYCAGLMLSIPSASVAPGTRLAGAAVPVLAAGATILILRLTPRNSQLKGSRGGQPQACAREEKNTMPRAIAASVYFLFLAVSLGLGLLMGSARIHRLGESYLALQDSKQLEAAVTVTSPAVQKDDKFRFNGKVEAIDPPAEGFSSEDVQVELRCRSGCPQSLLALSEGMIVRIRATVAAVVSQPDSDFDYGSWLKQRGINARLEAPAERLELSGSRRGGINGLMDSLRQYFRLGLNSGEWGDAGNLLQAMVLGDDHVVSDDIIEQFRASGLLHMLAVSGQNVALLGIIFLFLLRAMRVHRFAAVAVAMAAVAMYVPLTGAGPSIMRAGVVGLLGLAAFLFSRQSDRCHFLALSAAVLMSVNPYSVLDPGFQLSYAAVLAIFFLAPVIARPLAFMPFALREAVAISTATGLATAPITLANFGQVSLVTVPANVVAAPAAGPVMFLGVLAVGIMPLLPLAAWALVAAASMCTGYLISVAAFFASLPQAVYQGGAPGLVSISAFYCMLAAVVILSKKRKYTNSLQNLIRRRAGVTVPVLLIVALLGVFACVNAGPDGAPPSIYTVTFLDVGQGDAALLQLPPSGEDPDGVAVLIDGGPPGADVVAKLRARGVKTIDAVFLSHPDADHLAGLNQVLEEFEVRQVYDPALPKASWMYRDFLALVERKKIPYAVARGGQSLTFGELSLEILAPPEPLPPGDINSMCVVLVAGYQGIDILFPGDAEGEALSALRLPEVEVLKFPHHGSSDAGTSRVLRQLKPQAAVISVGAGNHYGHPHQATLDALERAGIDALRTDQHGDIRLSGSAGAFQIGFER
jgi:competence protein ComEC